MHSQYGRETHKPSKEPNFLSSNLCEVNSILRKFCGCYEVVLLISNGIVLYLLLWEIKLLHYQLLLVAKGASPGSEEEQTHWM